MTPVDESIGEGAPLNRSQTPSRTPAEQRRRQFIRRRATAAGALLLLIVWIVTLASSGGASRRPHATRGAARPVATGAAATAAAVAARTAAAAAAQQTAAIKGALTYTDYLTVGSANRRDVALTFDDGPGPFTPQVLSILERTHTAATFFVVGRSLQTFGATLPRELADGFVIGDHTQDHPTMTHLSAHDQEAEIVDVAQAMRTYGAPEPHLFRPPYGAFDKTTLAIAHRHAMLTVLWTVDTKDFSQPGVASIVYTALSGAKPGAIILMHDAGGPRAQTVAALPKIIAALRRRHFRLVTVPKLIADDPPLESQKTPPASLSGG